MKLTLTPPLTLSHWMRSTDLADAASAPPPSSAPTRRTWR